MSSGRKGKGRQKIEMKKMSNESNLQVTFSKRRSGLFKKVSELCTLCGVDVALVVFSPSEKVFSFGHPNIDSVIDRYFSHAPLQSNSPMQFNEVNCNTSVCELNTQLTQINNKLDEEKTRADELRHLRKAIEAMFWWACPIDGMDKVELELIKKALQELKNLVAQYANEIANQGAPTQTHPVYVGNASSSNAPLDHQPNPQQAQMFSSQCFQNPMLQPHSFGFNNIGGEGYGPVDSFEVVESLSSIPPLVL